MTFEEYQLIYLRTRNTRLSWFDEVGNAGMGLAGEAGEICDTLKKVLYHEHEICRQDFVHELGDLMWYFALTIDAVNLALTAKNEPCITLSEVLDSNIAKLKLRYPEGFDSQLSMHRTEEEDENV